MSEQKIDLLQVSNNLVASACKNMANLAGLVEQLTAQHPEKANIDQLVNTLVANSTKQIASLGNVIEQMAAQINQGFIEHNAQQGATDGINGTGTR